MSRFNGVVRNIQARANSAATEATDGLGLFLGHVTEQGIVTSRFKKKPIDDYKLLEYMEFKDIFQTTETGGEHSHVHRIKPPKELKPLQVGEIVLMALVEGDFIVLGRLKNKNGE